MSTFTRNAVLFTMLSCLVALTDSVADSSSPKFMSFLPDDAIPESTLQGFLDARHVGEYRVVEIDTNALRESIREAGAAASTSNKLQISFPLVNESTISVELSAAGEYHAGWQTGIASFHGKVVGEEFSTVLCVVGPDGSVDLVIRVPGERYKLEKTRLLPYHVYWTLGEEFEKRID